MNEKVAQQFFPARSIQSMCVKQYTKEQLQKGSDGTEKKMKSHWLRKRATKITNRITCGMLLSKLTAQKVLNEKWKNIDVRIASYISRKHWLGKRDCLTHCWHQQQKQQQHGWKIIGNVLVSIAIHQFCRCLTLWLHIFSSCPHWCMCVHACKVRSRVSSPSLLFHCYFDGCKWWWWWWCKVHTASHKCLKLQTKRLKQKLSHKSLQLFAQNGLH